MDTDCKSALSGLVIIAHNNKAESSVNLNHVSGFDYSSFNNNLGAFGIGWGIKEMLIQGEVADARGMSLAKVNNISYLRALGSGGAKYMKYVKGVGALASIAGTAVKGIEIYEKGYKNATVRDWTDLGVNAAGTAAVLFMASNPIGWAIGAGCLAYSVGTAIYNANN